MPKKIGEATVLPNEEKYIVADNTRVRVENTGMVPRTFRVVEVMRRGRKPRPEVKEEAK